MLHADLLPDNPRVHRRRNRLAVASLLLATIAGTSGCLGGAFLFPRIDFGSSPRDPYGWYATLDLDDGTRVRVGADTDGKDLRPAITRLAADGKVLWLRSYGRMGEGGHGIFHAVAARPDRGVLVASGEKGFTTLGLLGFDAAGALRWAEELELPAKAAGKVQVIAADDGAIAWVPVEEKGGVLRLFVARIDGLGAVRWASTWNLSGDVRTASWSGEVGLTLLGLSRDAKGSSAVLARAAPSGEARWMTRIANPPGDWAAASLATVADGSLLLAAQGARCGTCLVADVALSRFDAQGDPLWSTVVHRPLPAIERTRALAEHGRRGPSPPLLQTIAPGAEGKALVALTIPAAKPGQGDLALISVGARGEVGEQRAFLGWAGYPGSIAAVAGGFVVRGARGESCRITPGKPSSCGDREQDPGLASGPAPLDVGHVAPIMEPFAPKIRDLRDELARSAEPR